MGIIVSLLFVFVTFGLIRRLGGKNCAGNCNQGRNKCDCK